LSATTNTSSRSIGAVAELFDISQLYGTPEFSTIQNDAYGVWSNYPSTDPLDQGLAARLNSQFGVNSLGIHDFIDFNGKLSPNFDFTQTTGNPNNFVVAAKTGDIPAPTPGNVDWLELTNVDGGLANTVFRVDTDSGTPPSTVSISRFAIITHN
jgi:Protein of unknown function (DUF3455)